MGRGVGVLYSALVDTLRDIAILGSIWIALIALELCLPKSRVSWLSRLRSLTYWAISIPVWALIAVGYSMLWEHVGWKPQLTFAVQTWPEILVAVFASNFIADFFFYWRHRIQHQWFWRYHRVHHSIRELSGLSSYHHISEELFRIALVALPMSLLFDVQGAMIVGFVGSFIGFYAHASTRLTLGPLRYVILDPVFHRIHHSTDPKHFGKNFCAFTPLWDIAFGTAYFPKKGEWPETGLDDFAEPDGAWAWLSASREGRSRNRKATV